MGHPGQTIFYTLDLVVFYPKLRPSVQWQKTLSPPYNPKLLLRNLSKWLCTRDSQSRGSLVRPPAEDTKGPVFAGNNNLALHALHGTPAPLEVVMEMFCRVWGEKHAC